MKKLLLLSGKGGTGKTTTAAAFIAFSQAKAIADCDVDAPNLHIVTKTHEEPEKTPFMGAEKALVDAQKCVGCGLCQSHCRFDALQEKDGVYEVRDYACEGCGVCIWVCPQKAIEMVPDVAGEQLLFEGEQVFSTAKLKMGRGNSGKLVTSVKLSMLKHAPQTDLAIVDGSPGIGCPVIASMSGMDMVLVVTEPTVSGLSDLERLIHTAETFQTKLAVCVNKWDASPEHTKDIERFCQSRKVDFVGKIPYDPHASAAINEGKSLAEVNCPARDALWEIYGRVCKLMGLEKA